MTATTARVTALVLLLAAACVIEVVRRRREGRAASVAGGPTLKAADLGHPLGERATLLQISTSFCGPCRAAHRVLSGVAAVRPDVLHVELDAEKHLDLVRRLDVVRTPTLLVLDRTGRVRQRASGVPTSDQVLAALAATTVDGVRA